MLRNNRSRHDGGLIVPADPVATVPVDLVGSGAGDGVRACVVRHRVHPQHPAQGGLRLLHGEFTNAFCILQPKQRRVLILSKTVLFVFLETFGGLVQFYMVVGFDVKKVPFSVLFCRVPRCHPFFPPLLLM